MHSLASMLRADHTLGVVSLLLHEDGDLAAGETDHSRSWLYPVVRICTEKMRRRSTEKESGFFYLVT